MLLFASWNISFVMNEMTGANNVRTTFDNVFQLRFIAPFGVRGSLFLFFQCQPSARRMTDALALKL